ncbi:MAG: SMP-30/gluconolactonase/LRE family protein [Candidatus Handelsmanbacteria bacterium]|nr:SMP-30/gluconolactonase/LRE family protein [Candidatus Handelsmanbacteria bacterium]
MSWHFEQVAGPFSYITEGPAWDGEALFFTDIPNSRILRYDPRTRDCAVWRTGTNEANGLLFDREGRLYGCEGGGEGRRIVRYNADGSTAVLADRFEGKRLNSPNDLAFDAKGRLWFTDPRYGDREDDLELDHQSVFRLDPEPGGSWQLHRTTTDTTKPNGLLISPNQQWLYVAQSHYGEGNKRELRAYPIAADGSVGEYLVLHNFYPHRGIDGMCLDTGGNLVATAGWQQSGSGPMIYVFAPNGRVLETHPVPLDRPTNCTFGDPDLKTLYVTASGYLFRARTERQGLLVYPPAR